ncbi:hypothetical protein RB653_003268 [Dictyostelium firmibasis]|uniref:Uncharacterized protein n=1 Tax=Dictyostelium firmibasis TaxID=79012 RepID=A0AAN7TQ93_9MYCE
MAILESFYSLSPTLSPRKGHVVSNNFQTNDPLLLSPSQSLPLSISSNSNACIRGGNKPLLVNFDLNLTKIFFTGPHCGCN